ncbi:MULTISPECIES: hypothetical protein [unclassified Vibrio]|uniref:hypothetical protein n=1 Tax=unclassified Vibrio TaxID=2614977 RepID=UPI0027BDD8E5|nr:MULTISPECIES: hypothetical protein [unclassified Vibrio]MDQ2107634.1 hypothetical protein [Vibrio sp. 2017_1457_15]MDQ2160446.1 hypothetical protein [Vibrio sp. 2017_1457_13]
MKLKITSTILAVFATGCTSVQYNGSPDINVRRVDYPAIGQEITAYIGDHLVSKGTMAEMDVLKVTQIMESLAYDIPPSTYAQIGYDQKQTFYSPIGVVKSILADPYKALSVANGNTTEVCVVTIFGAKSCIEGEGKFSITKQASSFQDSFQQTLIYSGKIGNKVNISYREFSNNSARPAFNNEAEYDLSESNVIGYKGALLEVIDANNTSITYKLIRNFRD